MLFAKESKGGNPPSEFSTNEFGSWVNSNNLLSFFFLLAPFILRQETWVDKKW